MGGANKFLGGMMQLPMTNAHDQCAGMKNKVHCQAMIMNNQRRLDLMQMTTKITDGESLKFCKGNPSCVKKMMGANKHLGMMNLGMTNPHDQCAGMKNKVQCQIMIRNNQNRLDLMQMTSK